MVLGQSAGDLTLKAEALHDRAPRLGQLRLRGLHFALVDEADSVLIDEARTPLIISGPAASVMDRDTVARALELAANLEAGADYILSSEERRVYLTERGSIRVADFAASLSANWRGAVSREELARQALTALNLFNRDEHYVVADGKVKIVDEYTGRLMPDRFWSDGLHQMIEYKEGCELSDRRATIARMTYQRFFRRYRRLSGMSGTLRTVQRELWDVYRVPVVAIPTRKPLLRVHRPDVVVPANGMKWSRIIERVSEIHETGAPVLIGTRSVVASLEASERLQAAGLAHTVLNASQNDWEAQIIAQAGERGRITIATNMAGRGTDIQLGEGVGDLGGLHVIMTERHDALRIDQQLAGRSGRQGEPSSFEAILSMEDRLLEASNLFLRLATKALPGGAADWLARRASRLAQRRAERLHARMRAELLKSDQWQLKTLAFSGKSE
jgi:preprotein translocase subunit SecA